MNNPIREKSYLLAVGVVKFCGGPLGRRIAPVRKQLLRSLRRLSRHWKLKMEN